ncbi:MAG: RNA-binding S4 domain-containing protein [Bacillota bacterium]|nr:RNA-binding S4 domain-containing protein [Bacillota bacterium]HAN86679.1 RNA-binding protein [Bacillota bacterium]
MTLGIRTEHIELDQALKLAALVGSGGEAKMAIQSGWVKVNGVTEFRRGRKLREGDVFEFADVEATIVLSSDSVSGKGDV